MVDQSMTLNNAQAWHDGDLKSKKIRVHHALPKAKRAARHA
jgi:hypothetical protein